MQKMRRKGQMTIFAIIGILLLGVFFFLSYVNESVTEGRLESAQEKVRTDLLKSGAIPFYVDRCLDDVSKQAITLVGLQGGDIFNFQNGTMPLLRKHLNLSTPISYGISKPSLINGTVFPGPPGYPGGEERSKQVPALNFANWGKFGDLSLRKLCDTQGANSPFFFDPTQTIITNPFCLNNMYSDLFSTQFQMEQYIERQIQGCVDWDAIALTTGYNITELGPPEVTVRFGPNDVNFQVDFPLRLQVGGLAPITTIIDFHTRLPVRLKKIAEFASMMATYDSFVLNFNLTKDYRQISFWDSLMEVAAYTPFSEEGEWDEVVVIEDKGSVVDGSSYVYRFVRENRFPALDLIRQVEGNSTFDIIIMQNDSITLFPNPELRKQYDPDEDNLTYEYVGWKETCDERFNFDLGINEYQCSHLQPQHPDEFQPQHDRFPREWTGSEDYLLSRQNATYNTTGDDIGPHNVTVWVCDEERLCDFQVVKIMIFDFPRLNVTGKNPYDKIPDRFASVEDPYRLDASGTTSFFTPVLTYVFMDGIEPFTKFTEHPLQIVSLPSGEFNITNIINRNFSKAALDGEKSKVHKINLTVSPTFPPPVQLEVNVLQCLPHMNDIKTAPFPYHRRDNPEFPGNSPDLDPFLADHTCCGRGIPRFEEMLRRPYQEEVCTISDVASGRSRTIFIPFGSVPPAGFTAADCDGRNNVRTIRHNLGFDPTELFVTLTSFEDDGTEDSFRFRLSDGLTVPFGVVRDVAVIDKNIIEVKLPPTGPTDTIEAGPAAVNVTIEYEGPLTFTEFGTYKDSQTICYEEGPLFGPDLSFEEVPSEVTNFRDIDGAEIAGALPPAFVNDIMEENFNRRCSGQRGNVCDGVRTDIRKVHEECEDKDILAGDIETCDGPLFRKTDFLGTQIIKYPVKNSPGCTSGGYRAPDDGKTFEQIFEVKRFGLRADLKFHEDIPPNGTCNPLPTCSNDPELHDAGTSNGRFFIFSAGCQFGECSKATDSFDCFNFDGRTQADFSNDEFLCFPESACADPDVDCRGPNGAPGGRGMFAKHYECGKSTGRATCESIKGEFWDADNSEQACNACRDSIGNSDNFITRLTANNFKNSGPFQLRCCGDDEGEGGFPYSQVNNLGESDRFANRADVLGSTTFSPVEDCNDFYGGNEDNGIDNDCDGKINCADSDCVGEPGLKGSVCCTNDFHCADILPGSDCNSDNECDCGVVNPPAVCAVNPAAGGCPKTSILPPFQSCVSGETSVPGDKYFTVDTSSFGPEIIIDVGFENYRDGQNCQVRSFMRVIDGVTGDGVTGVPALGFQGSGSTDKFDNPGSVVLGFYRTAADFNDDCKVTVSVRNAVTT